MTPPSDIIKVGTALTAAAVVNTIKDDILLAAPGAGLRYRVFYIGYSETQNNAANVMRHILFDTGIATAIASCTTTQALSSDKNFYPQGVPCATNTAITTRNTCTVVNLAYRCELHYIIEKV